MAISYTSTGQRASRDGRVRAAIAAEVLALAGWDRCHFEACCLSNILDPLGTGSGGSGTCAGARSDARFDFPGVRRGLRGVGAGLGPVTESGAKWVHWTQGPRAYAPAKQRSPGLPARGVAPVQIPCRNRLKTAVLRRFSILERRQGWPSLSPHSGGSTGASRMGPVSLERL